MASKTDNRKSKAARAAKPAAKTARNLPDPAARKRSEHLANLIHDTFWLSGLMLTLYAAVSLFSFRMNDPAWSRSVPAAPEVLNLGGLFGAYFSDVLYYLWGFSAWWMVAAAAVFLIKSFRLLQSGGEKPYSGTMAACGLLLLLAFSPILEFALFGGRLADKLPAGAGGLMGSLPGGGLIRLLGGSGSLLILSAAVLLSLSLIAQVSLLDLAGKLGRGTGRAVGRLNRSARRQTAEAADSKTTRRMVREAKNIAAEPVQSIEGTRTNRKTVALNVVPPAPVQTALFDEQGQAAPPPVQGEYVLPALGLLALPKGEVLPPDPEKLQQTAEKIEAKLAEFNIEAQVVCATSGPVITRFEIEPAQGVKGAQIVALSKDLARAMSVQSVRVIETIAGKSTMGIELPNERRQEVTLREILASPVFTGAEAKLTVALGKDISGLPVVGDLAKMPHLLVAGMTGSGKSVGVNGMIMSILFKTTPEEVRLIMIDPKMLELSIYDGIPHLLCPVVTDMSQAGQALNWCVAEMEKRYGLLSHVKVRNLDGYNEKVRQAKAEGKPLMNPFSLNPDDPEPLDTLPKIVVVIDELADLMMTDRKSVETQIARLAQKARAAGIHLIIATQRPSVDVITGLIKANIPTRMAFTVQSKIDSRTILDQMGAEDLLKYGDLLFLQPGNAEPIRLQGAFVADHEVQEVVAHLKRQAPTHYIDGLLTGEAAAETVNAVNPNAHSDELFDQAAAFVIESRKTSISSLQRHLRIGYNRAANLMEALEQAGVVSAADVGGGRKILAQKDSV
ncbi:DNA translocase FtsK 4TM domain-containing protein [Neisseria leonii]|uniref:DNA translocase FtsK 4TM domain-containing protein n=1 Tax=Neisseria leonii TaxID=2995413 RepID=A0A9X4E293_9NEIS|nr:DNA translocase FtsK [Neisseria sp. 51.81]MDD9328281.1 DNA translocase FtsK 4TM domain-containing protein [Neisseria sp. 51.81]